MIFSKNRSITAAEKIIFQGIFEKGFPTSNNYLFIKKR